MGSGDNLVLQIIDSNLFPLSLSVSTGVRLLEDSAIPPHALRGQKAVLRCNYDLEGDNLYSVKWYYNQKEFYRFIPSDNPKVTIFNHHPGVNVNVSGYSTSCYIFDYVLCSPVYSVMGWSYGTLSQMVKLPTPDAREP